MSYVYILLLRNKRIYTGYTKNIKRRIKEHKNKKVKSTKNLIPLKLVLCEIYHLDSDARRREKFLKTTEGKRLLKKQIRDSLLKNA